jgi:hypothetical protein
MCNKHKHANMIEAQGHMLKLMASPVYTGHPLHAYYCKWCQAFHVTSKPQTTKK